MTTDAVEVISSGVVAMAALVAENDDTYDETEQVLFSTIVCLAQKYIELQLPENITRGVDAINRLTATEGFLTSMAENLDPRPARTTDAAIEPEVPATIKQTVTVVAQDPSTGVGAVDWFYSTEDACRLVDALARHGAGFTHQRYEVEIDAKHGGNMFTEEAKAAITFVVDDAYYGGEFGWSESAQPEVPRYGSPCPKHGRVHNSHGWYVCGEGGSWQVADDNTKGPVIWVPSEESIMYIVQRKIGGRDCSEKESTMLKQYLGGGVNKPLIKSIRQHFPMEWEEAELGPVAQNI